ncbi:unnamed protein product [Arctia plantaginis]|uniref:Uncharacterized protein n=1 Tax=Arctia plantaginis TaxID=874455 RepID=A0A8S1A7N7_ARCPL|nr:unnamed protein product [Arctia plantaginis]
MHKITLFILAAVFAVALAEGQYYVPRAYYTIDAEGHESARVPLRRLRRSLQPLPYAGGARAVANANNYGPGNADAEATANNYGPGGWGNGGGNGGWGTPRGSYGSAKPLAH